MPAALVAVVPTISFCREDAINTHVQLSRPSVQAPGALFARWQQVRARAPPPGLLRRSGWPCIAAGQPTYAASFRPAPQTPHCRRLAATAPLPPACLLLLTAAQVPFLCSQLTGLGMAGHQ